MPRDVDYSQPTPSPDGASHVQQGHDRRIRATDLSAPAVQAVPNGEAEAFAGTWPTNFSKGLPHDALGIVDAAAYRAFFDQVADPDYVPGAEGPRAPFAVPHASADAFRTESPSHEPFAWRAWESPIAGHQFVLEGPDPAALGMAPAPRLGSDELAAEMAEVYAMALLRDCSFEEMRAPEGPAGPVTAALCQMAWFDPDRTPTDAGGGAISEVSAARRARDGGGLVPQTLFRGSSPGCAVGPYLSQFLLQGHDARGGSPARLEGTLKILDRSTDDDGAPLTADKGKILYGAQRVDQRIEPQAPGIDYMRDWAEWLDVQNGANTAAEQAFDRDAGLKFVETPRDLATYVHFDALYQAYLNACLLMLGWRTPFDPGLPEPTETRQAFATWGGPHVLTLVTEVATRALRAVRRQKFQVHNRARPEALGGMATLSANGCGSALGAAEHFAHHHVRKLETAVAEGCDLVAAIAGADVTPRFKARHGAPDDLPEITRNLLLPMAFPEGSPMHPAYGAGHATVAGACVTVLKAFFQTHVDHAAISLGAAGAPGIFVPAPGGKALVAATRPDDTLDRLTLNGELNKLAANISIGRNMAGVHYYSDYFDSVRMGERLAVGLLQEQMATYTEGVSLTLESFDGEILEIHGDGAGGAGVRFPCGTTLDAWWVRHLPDQGGR